MPQIEKPNGNTGRGKKNVLLITADQWRGDCLSAVHHPLVKTPMMDELAADAALFSNHYTTCVPCGPARASLYTGMYLQNHRSCRNGTPLDERFTNLALEARKAGYDPVLFGYSDTSRDPRHTPLETIKETSYEGVLPGFHAELSLPDHAKPWRDYLSAKGYDIDEAPFAPARSGDDAYMETKDKGCSLAPTQYAPEDSPTAFLAGHVIDYLSRQQQDGWFVHASFLRPHPPFIAPEPYNAMYNAADVPEPIYERDLTAHRKSHPWLELAFMPRGDWPDRWMYETLAGADYDRNVRQLRATYYGLVTKIDHYIGQVIAQLKRSGAYDNTLIIVTSDHGEMLGDHWLFGKRSFYDQSYHIPLIIRDPRRQADAARGVPVAAFSESIDIMPTILNWLEIDVPRQCDGASLLPLAAGTTPENWRTEVHWEYDFRDVQDPWIETTLDIALDHCTLNVIRDEAYKYVHFTALPPLFFDLKNDPDECNNLADDPGYTQIMLHYAQKMLSWRMANDERTLTAMTLTTGGVVERR